jgi:D-amino peptidase
MKVLIAVDMEGISGVVNWDHVTPGHPEYQRFRKIMTGDVLAAVRGARQGGADKIVVSDGHDSKTNILIEDFPTGVRLNSGTPSPFGMVEGIDQGIDAVLFVGYHSRVGTLKGILAHTWSKAKVSNLWINGRIAGEIGLNGCVCGHFGAPVIMISGDYAACQEAEEWSPGIVKAVVKVGTAYSAAECLPPVEAQQLIEEKAAEAVSQFLKGNHPAPMKTSNPVKISLEFAHSGMPDVANQIPGSFRPDGRTIEVTGENMAAAYIAYRAAVTLGN